MSLGSAAVLPHAGPNDLAIDLGTANTRVYIPGEGVVLDEPSVIAIDVRDKKVLAVGRLAKAMTGRAPESIQVISPVRRGVIADVGAAREMLDHFMRAVAGRWRVRRPRVAVVVPYGTTQVEKRAVRELGGSVGAGKVHLIEEPVASALGVGLPVSTPGAHTIVTRRSSAPRPICRSGSAGSPLTARCSAPGGPWNNPGFSRPCQSQRKAPVSSRPSTAWRETRA